MERTWLMVKRIEAKMNRRELAEKVNISYQQICNIENGSRYPSGKVAYRIAKVLDFPMERFFEDEETA